MTSTLRRTNSAASSGESIALLLRESVLNHNVLSLNIAKVTDVGRRLHAPNGLSALVLATYLAIGPELIF